MIKLLNNEIQKSLCFNLKKSRLKNLKIIDFYTLSSLNNFIFIYYLCILLSHFFQLSIIVVNLHFFVFLKNIIL